MLQFVRLFAVAVNFHSLRSYVHYLVLRVLAVNRSLSDRCAQAAASTFNWPLQLQYCWFIWTISLLSLSIRSSHNHRFDYSTAAILPLFYCCHIHVFPYYWPLILFLTGEQGIFNMSSDLCMLLCKVGTQADESTQVSTWKKWKKKNTKTPPSFDQGSNPCLFSSPVQSINQLATNLCFDQHL